MAKYLIINADDFGIAPGVNQAIVELYHAGIVTSTSIIVNMPGFKDAIRKWHYTRNLGIGLHFNLSSGSPISPLNKVPSLVDDQGVFNHDLNWNENEVKMELIAQMERLLDQDIEPTHIDSHGFIQTREVVWRPMVTLALKMNLPLRRTGWEPPLDIPDLPVGVERFFSDTYFEKDGRKLLLKNLRSVPHGTSELICHPGYVDKTLEKVCTWTKVREKELAVMKNPQLLVAIRALGIQLINYRDLKYLKKLIKRKHK